MLICFHQIVGLLKHRELMWSSLQPCLHCVLCCLAILILERGGGVYARGEELDITLTCGLRWRNSGLR